MVDDMPAAMYEAMVDCKCCDRDPREEEIAAYVKSVRLAKAEDSDRCNDEGFGNRLVAIVCDQNLHRRPVEDYFMFRQRSGSLKRPNLRKWIKP